MAAGTALTIQELPLFGLTTALAWTAADATDGNTIPGDGKTLVLVRGKTGGTHKATMVSVADKNNRTGDIATAVLAVNETAILYPSRPSAFQKAQGDADNPGLVLITVDGANIEFAAVRLQK